MTPLPYFGLRGEVGFGASFASLVRRLTPMGVRAGRARYGMVLGKEALVATTDVRPGDKQLPVTTFTVKVSPPLFLQLLVNPRSRFTLPAFRTEPLAGLLTGDRAWDEAHFVTCPEEERALRLLSPELRTSLRSLLATGPQGPFALAMNDTMVGVTLTGANFTPSFVMNMLRGAMTCADLLTARARQLPPAESLVRLSNEWAAFAGDRHMRFDAECMQMQSSSPAWTLDVALEPTPRCVYVSVTARLLGGLDVAFELHEGHLSWFARKLEGAMTVGEGDIDEHYVVHADANADAKAKDRVRRILALPAVHALLSHHDAEVSLSSTHVFLRMPGLDPTIAVDQVTAAANAMMGTNVDATHRPYR